MVFLHGMVKKFIIKQHQINIFNYYNFDVEIFMSLKILIYPWDMVIPFKD